MHSCEVYLHKNNNIRTTLYIFILIIQQLKKRLKVDQLDK